MLESDDQHFAMSCFRLPNSLWKCNFIGKESLLTTIWLAPRGEEGEGASPPTPEPVKQMFLSVEWKARLKGNNLGKQWPLTKVMALQQVVPKKLSLPLKSELITSVRHLGTPERDDQHCCMSWFPGKSPKKAALLVVSSDTFPFLLDGWLQELLSNGAKIGLEGNKLDKQFPSISKMALQQEEPIMLNWPLISEPKTWVRHPSMFTRDD